MEKVIRIYKPVQESFFLPGPRGTGQALEGLVAQHLRAWIDYRLPAAKLYYWRTSAGTEVDFVVYGKDLFLTIEVKNSARVQPQDMKALRTFGEDYPEAKRFLLYRGREKLLRDGITIQPCQDFLLGLA
jgi:predicted AAA+ superfamily ATPase